jgi:hypothetical protein
VWVARCAARSAFLAAYDLPKAAFISASGAIGLAADTSRMACYLASGFDLPAGLWWDMPVFIATSFAGAWLANRLADRIPQKAFRKVIAVFLLLAGLKLLLVPWPFRGLGKPELQCISDPLEPNAAGIRIFGEVDIQHFADDVVFGNETEASGVL